MSEPRTRTLDVPGGRLHYDIRAAEAETTAPILLMFASPMDTSGFTTLAGYFRDRTRGHLRSARSRAQRARRRRHVVNT